MASEIPYDILRALKGVAWAWAYVDEFGVLRLHDGAPRGTHPAYWSLSYEQRSTLHRAMDNTCRTPLDRTVREYMLWRAYSTRAEG